MTLTKTAFYALILLPSFASAQSADSENKLQFSITAGIVSAPNFLGDDDRQIVAAPNLTVNYGDRFTASLDGVRYSVFSRNGLEAGVVGAYHFGRDENPQSDGPLIIKSDGTSDLDGLGDIDGTVELGGFVAFQHDQFIARAEIRRGVDGGHDGLVGEAEVTYNGTIGDMPMPVYFSVGPAIAFGDDAYNSAFFDVSAVQSAASGISEYDADGGLISYGLHGTAVIPLCDTTSLIGFASFDRLSDEIADSSIVDERGTPDQVSAGLLINYTF